MAVRFLNGEVSELCLGKPELTWVGANASISDALTTLKASGDAHVSVWVCNRDSANASCRCVGAFSVADVILFLCKEANLTDPFKALESPVCDILPEGLPLVRHLEPNSSLLEAIDNILEGTPNLVIPIKNHQIANSRKKQILGCARGNGHAYCWLTREDVVRFLLNSIGIFSPFPTYTIKSLNIIDHDFMAVPLEKPASSALGYFYRALNEQLPVAVVDEENRLIGEISPFTLACCDETAAAAIMSLSAGDLMAYIDCGGPPEDLVRLVKMRLEERNLEGMVEFMDEFFNPCTSSSSSNYSSHNESVSSRNGGSSGSQYHPARGSTAMVCSPGSSLVAVMIQALANRVSCLWVVEEDQTLVGIVTFAGMLKVLRNIAMGKHD